MEFEAGLRCLLDREWNLLRERIADVSFHAILARGPAIRRGGDREAALINSDDRFIKKLVVGRGGTADVYWELNCSLLQPSWETYILRLCWREMRLDVCN
jgi:hypothetical protein